MNPIDLAALRTHPGWKKATKRAFPVSVHFTSSDCIVSTLEGDVAARAHDAVVTGQSGEQWPVPRARFAEKYQPVAPGRFGMDGTYLSVPINVMALQMQEPFSVALTECLSTLHGKPGDWLIDYGDATLSVVAGAIFEQIYELTTTEK